MSRTLRFTVEGETTSPDEKKVLKTIQRGIKYWMGEGWKVTQVEPEDMPLPPPPIPDGGGTIFVKFPEGFDPSPFMYSAGGGGSGTVTQSDMIANRVRRLIAASENRSQGDPVATEVWDNVKTEYWGPGSLLSFIIGETPEEQPKPPVVRPECANHPPGDHDSILDPNGCGHCMWCHSKDGCGVHWIGCPGC